MYICTLGKKCSIISYNLKQKYNYFSVIAASVHSLANNADN